MLKTSLVLLLVSVISLHNTSAYSAREDARIIAAYKREMKMAQLNHAKIARKLVHQADWTSVGTISTNSDIAGYPMVNIISVDDGSPDGKSTGKIRFMLTDLDFTGPDWRHDNKVTMLFTDDQNENCKHRGVDPMEPTCARTIISGQVKQLDTNNSYYEGALKAFTKRHPASLNWMKAHMFYLCELKIDNIFVLDFYGGPHTVTPEVYYNTDPDVNSAN